MAQSDASPVDEDVDATMALGDCGHRRLNRRFVPDIDGVR
jgi:hypothetical protein